MLHWIEKVTGKLPIHVHPRGEIIVVAAAALSILLLLVWFELGLLALVVALGLAWMLRDPERMVPQGKHFVLAPADGVVESIEEASLPEGIVGVADEGVTYQRLTIAIGAMDAHVCRAPVAGNVVRDVFTEADGIACLPSQAREKAERSLIAIRTEEDELFACSQIAGVISRSVLCQVYEGDSVQQGARYGLIRLGCHSELYIPDGYNLTVAAGSRVVAGETIVATKKKGFSYANLSHKAM